MIKAISARAKGLYCIEVTLADGTVIEHDMSYLSSEHGPVVDAIKSAAEFAKVFIDRGIVSWPSGYDIDPYFLVESSTPHISLKAKI